MKHRPGVQISTDIVLIGGGHAHVTVLKRFAMAPMAGVRLTLISPDAHTPYSGMLPGLIAGHYTYDEAHIDLVPLCRFAGAVFVRAHVTALDPATKLIHCGDRPPIPYDLLSINAGSTPDQRRVPGASGVVLPVKPVAAFLDHWAELKRRVLQKPGMHIGVVGAGAGGIELLLSAQFEIDRLLRKAGIAARPSYSVATGGPDILETHNSSVRAIFRNVLDERSVTVVTGFRVDRVTPGFVHDGARSLAFDAILWCTGAAPPAWIADSGLATDESGFMVVDDTLRSTSHADVFGAGDMASQVGHPRPKSGVFAVRQGLPLAENLRRSVLDRPLRRHKPQSRFLGLISTGNQHAVASWGPLSARGNWVWRWKDRIDREFMVRFNDLPDMSSKPPRVVRAGRNSAPPDTAMRCGGCGAKVGARTLTSALGGLQVTCRDNVIVGLGEPDDAAVIRVPADKLVVQSADFFRAMIDDPYVFGRIAANHSLGDLYAMGADPETAMAIATVPYELLAKSDTTLSQMMAGAVSVLNAAGCQLVGGHTAEAGELALGFAVTGTVAPNRVWRKSGMLPGNRLILTKPLGSGVIFAANMRAKAKGRWVAAAIDVAEATNRTAAAILQDAGATACTDVTGFGLVGHLVEMLDASEVGATLELDAVPTIDGAQTLSAAGFASTLYPDNLAVRDRISGTALDAAVVPLLFDPQTAGGLLASVPAEAADACLARLLSSGYPAAAIIGRVEKADTKKGQITIVTAP